MKQFLKNSATLALAAVLTAFALFVIGYQPTSDAQVYGQKPLPQSWADSTGSNAFALSASALPTLTKSGIVYTGATTNLAVYDGDATNTLVIVNGICTGVQ